MLRGRMFTLVEMLVVVAIISILASLLAPSLHSALETARSTGCLNNQKQIYYTLNMYENDFGNKIIPLEYINNTSGYTGMLADYGYLTVSNKSLTAPIGAETTIFFCPSGEKMIAGAIASRYDINGAGAMRYTSTVNGWVIYNNYALNSSTFDKGFLTVRVPLDITGDIIVRNKSSVRSPGKFVLLFDGFYTNFGSRPERVNARHLGKSATNILYVDGSAKSTGILQVPENFSLGHLRANYPHMLWRIDQ